MQARVVQVALRIVHPVLPYPQFLVQILLFRSVVVCCRVRRHLQHEVRHIAFLPELVRIPAPLRHAKRHEHVRSDRRVRVALVIVDQQVAADVDVAKRGEVQLERLGRINNCVPLPVVGRHRLAVLAGVLDLDPRPRRALGNPHVPERIQTRFKDSPLRQTRIRSLAHHAHLPGAAPSRLRSIPSPDRTPVQRSAATGFRDERTRVRGERRRPSAPRPRRPGRASMLDSSPARRKPLPGRDGWRPAPRDGNIQATGGTSLGASPRRRRVERGAHRRKAAASLRIGQAQPLRCRPSSRSARARHTAPGRSRRSGAWRRPGKKAYCQLPMPADPNQRRRGSYRQLPRHSGAGAGRNRLFQARRPTDGGQRLAGDGACGCPC